MIHLLADPRCAKRPKPPAVTREQWKRLHDELPGDYVVVGLAEDPKHPPIYAGFRSYAPGYFFQGINIALGRGHTVDQAIDALVRRMNEHRRTRRLEKSPLEWLV